MAPRPDVPGVALITGSASGIGRAAAQAFVNAGCTNLALLDINEEGLQTAKKFLLDSFANTDEQTTLKIETYYCDVSSPQSIVEAYAKARSSFGRIDYSVHCAGIILFVGPSTEVPVEAFDRQNTINYRGLWLCSREALKIMKEQPLDSEVYPDIKDTRAQRGAIVNISSGLGLVSQAGSNAYSGAKAGVMALTRSDAIDYVADRIRVNAVLPGIVDTPITTPSPEIRAILEAGPVQRTPMKRFGLAEEIADVIVFLASTKASFVTGSCWSVDGGFLAC